MPRPMSLARSALVGLLVCSSSALAQGAGAGAEDATAAGGATVVARVNGAAIPGAHLEFLVRRATAAGQADTPELRKVLRERLISQEVVAQAAASAGLDQNPAMRAQLELARQELLASAFLAAVTNRNPPAEDALRKAYDSIVAAMGRREYRVRHLLLASEAEARAAIDELGAGAAFEKVAERSRDAPTAQRGGELGWVGPEQVVKPFAEAMEKLQKGQTSAPVQSQHGWHVIRVEDSRERQIPTFEQARPRLLQQFQRQQAAQIVRDLVGKAKIE